ncbi:hypothetical protein NDU88_002083 [Pleurodeles waltl]|uniref:Uncharacterized protein n=1 Tax=Pleurodeles waltl TaxID=8319 RepID=A0AAV7NFC7_PLEWA|nr:hypothetical protein NDU88_002083 [Pleurodeles waltl]
MGSGDPLSRNGRGNQREREGPLGPDCGAGTDPWWNRTTQHWKTGTSDVSPSCLVLTSEIKNNDSQWFTYKLLHVFARSTSMGQAHNF